MPGGPVHEGATANLSVLKLAHKLQYVISPDLFQQEASPSVFVSQEAAKGKSVESPQNMPVFNNTRQDLQANAVSKIKSSFLGFSTDRLTKQLKNTAEKLSMVAENL